MSNELTSCLFCGRFVLQITGWTGEIRDYRLMRATWESGHRFLAGSVHFTCLREAETEVRDGFRAEFQEIVTGTGRDITFEVEGTEHTMTQPGMGYTDQLFAGETCVVYRSPVTDSWFVQEHAGPWYFLNPAQLKDIAEDRPARAQGDVDRVVLPKDPGPEIAEASLTELLGYLRLETLYQDALENGSLEYEFWDYYAPKRILEYAVDATLPLPAEAVEFLKGYFPDYRPINFDELE